MGEDSSRKDYMLQDIYPFCFEMLHYFRSFVITVVMTKIFIIIAPKKLTKKKPIKQKSNLPASFKLSLS